MFKIKMLGAEIAALKAELAVWKKHDEEMRRIIFELRLKNDSLKIELQQIANKLVLLIEKYR